MTASATKPSPSVPSGSIAAASAPAIEMCSAKSTPATTIATAHPATVPPGSPKRERPSATAPAIARHTTIAARIAARAPSSPRPGCRTALAMAASASRGSARPNATNDATTASTSEYRIRCASVHDSRATMAIDASANASAIVAGTARASAIHPWNGRAASSAMSASSATTKATGSDSCRARTAGASEKRCAAGATARSSRATRPSPPGMTRTSEPADDRLDAPDDRDIVGVDWRHRGVLRLQADPPALAVEALDGRLAVDHCDHDLAVVGARRRLDQDEVPVEDRGVDHRVALDPEHEAAAPRRPRRRQDELVLEVLGRRDRNAGGDPPDDRQRHGVDRGGLVVAAGRDQRTRLRRIAPQEAVALERLEVRLHRGRRRKPDPLADLPHRRRVPALAREAPDHLEDALLLLGRGSLRHRSLLARMPPSRH